MLFTKTLLPLDFAIEDKQLLNKLNEPPII